MIKKDNSQLPEGSCVKEKGITSKTCKKHPKVTSRNDESSADTLKKFEYEIKQEVGKRLYEQTSK